ncbi:zinc ribbon domain-containing protein [uncultured Methanobrevibacter sp.]|uniref:zinc ribbon domain-containing protein n=1 Tax=uncultured Methanobrevibacter sp. TaxID=253161 RepID=UPI0025E67912|nr:zinc ribbon domain-containing protein [uncultured Methanobrevibacter sp.]
MTKYCTECGCENLDDANFCSDCGLPFDEYDHSPLDANAPLEIPKKYNTFNISGKSSYLNCRQNSLIHLKKSALLSEKAVYFCTNCGLTLEKSGNSFKIVDILDRNNHMWKLYRGRQFKIDDLEHIVNGGLSLKDQEKQNDEIESLREQLFQLEMKRDIEIITQSLSKGEINLSTVNSPTDLRDNEVAYVSLPNIKLCEAEMPKNAIYETSFKLSKGVTLKSGVGKTASASPKNLMEIDSGTFIITNRRVIFVGGNSTTSIDLIKILSINVFKDGISIISENNKDVIYFSGTDRHTLSFAIDGRERTLTLEGNIIRFIILGQIAKIK